MRKPRLPSLDEKLDEALKATFPASDPFALFPQEFGTLAVHRRTDDDRAVERKPGDAG
jgi:hypothetical protein